MRYLFLIISCSLFLSPLHAQSGGQDIEPIVLEFVADIEAGRKEKVIERISGVHSISGYPRIVKTGAEFFDIVNGCKGEFISSTKSFSIFYKYGWNCSTGYYVSSISKHPRANYIEIAEFSDEKRLEELKTSTFTLSRVRRSIPITRPTVESPRDKDVRLKKEKDERKKILSLFELAFVSENLTYLDSVIDSKSNLKLGYRDLENNIFITELDGNGMLELKKQYDWLIENVGAFKSVTCKSDRLSGNSFFLLSCNAKTGQAGYGFNVQIFQKNGLITSMQFSYLNLKFFEKNLDYLKENGFLK